MLRCSKNIIKPNNKQRTILTKWMELYRDVYNVSIKHIRNPNNKIGSKIDFRRDVKVTFPSLLLKELAFAKMPVHMYDNAIFDAHKGYKIWIKSNRCRPMRYKKVANLLYIEKTMFSKMTNGFCKTVLGSVIKSQEALTNIKNDCRLTYKNGTYTLHIPSEKELCIHPIPINKCALDPGIRVFQTGYTTLDHMLEYGNQLAKLDRLVTNLSRSLSNFDNIRSKMTRFNRRLYRRIGGLVDDLHWKTAIELCKNHTDIAIGKLSTKSISCNKTSKLSGFNKEKAKFLGHYTFRMRLKQKAEEYGRNFYEINEYMTSKTCNQCGYIKNDLGASKTYHCNNCKLIIDRDLNAAKNIYKRAYC